MKITTNYLRQVIKEELEAVLAEEEKSLEWKKAYDEKYKEIANGLIDGNIDPFNDPDNFTPDDLDFYRDELNMRRFEPYGGSGDETDAMINLAKRKAAEYATKYAKVAGSAKNNS